MLPYRRVDPGAQINLMADSPTESGTASTKSCVLYFAEEICSCCDRSAYSTFCAVEEELVSQLTCCSRSPIEYVAGNPAFTTCGFMKVYFVQALRIPGEIFEILCWSTSTSKSSADPTTFQSDAVAAELIDSRTMIAIFMWIFNFLPLFSM